MDNSTMVDSVFQERFSNLMKERGITQAEASDGIGVTRQAISLYATGKRTPDINSLYRICDFFKVSADYFLGLSDVRSKDLDIKSISKKTGLNEDSIKMITAFNNKEKPFTSHTLNNSLLNDGLNSLLCDYYFYRTVEDLIILAREFTYREELREILFITYCEFNNVDYDDLLEADQNSIVNMELETDFNFIYTQMLNLPEIDIDYKEYRVSQDFKRVIDELKEALYNNILEDSKFKESLNNSEVFYKNILMEKLPELIEAQRNNNSELYGKILSEQKIRLLETRITSAEEFKKALEAERTKEE